MTVQEEQKSCTLDRLDKCLAYNAFFILYALATVDPPNTWEVYFVNSLIVSVAFFSFAAFYFDRNAILYWLDVIFATFCITSVSSLGYEVNATICIFGLCLTLGIFGLSSIFQRYNYVICQTASHMFFRYTFYYLFLLSWGDLMEKPLWKILVCILTYSFFVSLDICLAVKFVHGTYWFVSMFIHMTSAMIHYVILVGTNPFERSAAPWIGALHTLYFIGLFTGYIQTKDHCEARSENHNLGDYEIPKADAGGIMVDVPSNSCGGMPI